MEHWEVVRQMKLVAGRNGMMVALLDCRCIFLHRILVSDEAGSNRRGLGESKNGVKRGYAA